jgi:probable rRNA maturation factor
VLSEVTMLIVHGVLHLLGWDHDTRAKNARMRAETDRLCRLAARSSISAGTSSSGRRGKSALPKPSHGRRSRARP